MLPSFQTGDVLPVILLRQPELLQSHGNAVGKAGTARIILSIQRCPHFLKNPGVTEYAASDHQAVGPCAFQAAHCRVPAANIAVGNDRNRQLLPDLVNHIPVGDAGIEHTAGAPVDGHHGRAAVLHAFGEVQHIDAALVPAKAALDSDRHVHCLHHRFDNIPCQLRGAHQAAAIAGIRDFRHGTAHVDVQKVTAGDFQRQYRTLRHDLRVIAKNLRAADAALVLSQQLGALFVLIHQRPGGHHLCHGHIRSQPGADGSKSPVRNPRHGGQEQRLVQFYVS